MSAGNEVTQGKPSRVHTLDIVRGFSMFFICGGEYILLALCMCLPESRMMQALSEQLGHVAWEGFTFYDLIFPTFLLVSGASFTYSWLSQTKRGVPVWKRWQHLFLRTLLLCFLGFLYNGNLAQPTIDTMRFPSVLARIGLGVFLAAIPYTLTPLKWRWLLFPLGLAAYAGLFVCCGGEQPYARPDNWAGAVDAWLLPGVTDVGVKPGLDAEGVVSTFGAMWTAYLGMLLGDFLRSKWVCKSLWLYEGGVILIVAAYGMEPWVPIVKKLWSASYVCLAGGWTLLLCALVYLLADTLRCAKAFFPLTVLGVNALWFYFLAYFVDFKAVAWQFVSGGVGRWVRADSPEMLNAYYTLAYAIAGFVLLWLTVWFIYRQKQALRTWCKGQSPQA